MKGSSSLNLSMSCTVRWNANNLKLGGSLVTAPRTSPIEQAMDRSVEGAIVQRYPKSVSLEVNEPEQHEKAPIQYDRTTYTVECA